MLVAFLLKTKQNSLKSFTSTAVFEVYGLCLLATVQMRQLSLFRHIAWMSDESDAKQILTASPLKNWRRPPGRRRTTCMKTTQQHLESLRLSLNEAIDMAQNCPLWRLMSTFGTTHSAVHARNEWMNGLCQAVSSIVESVFQGYKMDDLLTSYISLMLATMNKQRTMTLRRH